MSQMKERRLTRLALVVVAATVLVACTRPEKRDGPAGGAIAQPAAGSPSDGQDPTEAQAEGRTPDDGGQGRRPRRGGWKTYSNRVYRVVLRHPPEWQGPMEGTAVRHEGTSGFFDLGAASGGGATLNEVCRSDAGHKLNPFGTRPRIESLRVQGQEACLILPSSDQPRDMKGHSQLLVRYPEPVQVGGSRYELLALYADRDHVRAIARTLRFLPVAQGGGTTTRCAKVSGGKAGVVANLVDVRLTTSAGHDRMTFVFEPASVPTPDGGRTRVQPGAPRYELDTARPPFAEDPSGRPMAVSGNAFSRITFHGASGVDLSGTTARRTYLGPRRFTPGFSVLREAQQEGDFESTSSWILGLSRPRCPRAVELSNPTRVVVEFPHGPRR